MTNGTYTCSIVTNIFRCDLPGHGGDCKTSEVMTSTEPLGTFTKLT